MIKAILTGSSVCLLALLASVPASAQFGVITSPPPEGLEAGESAGYTKGNFAALDALPDWGGAWFTVFEMPAPGSNAGPPPAPKIKGKYLEGLNAVRAEAAANNGQVKRERSNCSPPGMPIIMQIPQYPFEFLFTPGRVTINQEAWMQTRTIWTDGREHPEDPDPTFNGHSIGHWEGDTLVVDTIAVADFLEFSNGMQHSDKFHIVERIGISKDDPDKLTVQMTMDDPEALEETYTSAVSYKRDRDGRLLEFQCSENDRNTVDEHGDSAGF